MILLSTVRILYSSMLIILLSFIVGIVIDVVKLVCFSYIFIMYYKYNLQTNAGEGDQNVDENTENDFEVENDSQKEDNDSIDDWSSNIYFFKFGEGYYSFHVLMNILC